MALSHQQTTQRHMTKVKTGRLKALFVAVVMALYGANLGLHVSHRSTTTSRATNLLEQRKPLVVVKDAATPVVRNDANSPHQQPQQEMYDSPEFQFSRANLADGPHLCGWNKCLFPLVHNPSIGYLVSNGAMISMPILKDSYALTNRVIQGQFGMEHIYLGPPQVFERDADLFAWMDGNKTLASQNRKDRSAGFAKKDHVIIQLVRVIPNDPSKMMILGCSDKKFGNRTALFDAFLDQHLVPEFSVSFDKLVKLVEYEHCLAYDFQVFLLADGRIVHFDTDRCFQTSADETKKNLKIQECLPKLQEMRDRVAQRLALAEQRQRQR